MPDQKKKYNARKKQDENDDTILDIDANATYLRQHSFHLDILDEHFYKTSFLFLFRRRATRILQWQGWFTQNRGRQSNCIVIAWKLDINLKKREQNIGIYSIN